MKIVVVGGGRVGASLAEKLSGQGHDVAIVERDLDRAAELDAELDVQVVEGNGATPDALRKAGAGDAQLVVATTESDEANFVTGRVAAALFKVQHVVVRLRDAKLEEAFSALSRGDAVEVACVNPEGAAAEKILALLDVPGALELWSFLDGDLLVAGFRIPPDSEFADRPVLDMRLFFAETPSLVAAIQRGDRALVPHGAERIRVGDIVCFALARSDLDAFLELIGLRGEARRRVMVGGATRIGIELARRLAERDVPVTLLEPDDKRSRRAREQVGEPVTVVRGPVTRQSILEEEDIDKVNTFVAVTDDHEQNLVAGLLAKRLGARRAFALVDNPALASLIGETAIDAIISPRLLAIGHVLQNIPGAQVRKVATLLGDRVEVFEAAALAGSALCKAPIAELDLPRGVLIAAIRREGRLRVPRGDDRVEPNDTVVMVAATEHARRLQEVLSERARPAARAGLRPPVRGS